MRKSTRLIASTLMISLLTGVTVASAASDKGGAGEVDRTAFQELAQLMSKQSMSDTEISNFLRKRGWAVAAKSTKHIDSNGNIIDPTSISAEETPVDSATLTIWQTYNDHIRDEWTVYGSVYPNFHESYPATYDVVSIDWDKNLWDYRSSSGSDGSTYVQDVTKRFDGTLIFGMRDNPYGTAYVWVGLKQKTLGTDAGTTTGIQYVHTYQTTQISTSYSGSAGITWGQPLTLGVSYSVNVTTSEAQWKSGMTSDYFELN